MPAKLTAVPESPCTWPSTRGIGLHLHVAVHHLESVLLKFLAIN